MRGERLVQYTVALVIISAWLFAVIIDARSDTYSVPKEVSGLAFLATGFVLGMDKLVALVSAWRRPPPPEQESK